MIEEKITLAGMPDPARLQPTTWLWPIRFTGQDAVSYPLPDQDTFSPPDLAPSRSIEELREFGLTPDSYPDESFWSAVREYYSAKDKKNSDTKNED